MGHNLWYRVTRNPQEFHRLTGGQWDPRDRGVTSQFTSRFWKELQLDLGTLLNFSTAFHLQTDGQSERFIQVLEVMLRGCVMEFTGSWDRYIPLIEFAYNNSYQSSIGIAPYEALYG